jgi:hypothetical protein
MRLIYAQPYAEKICRKNNAWGTRRVENPIRLHMGILFYIFGELDNKILNKIPLLWQS